MMIEMLGCNKMSLHCSLKDVVGIVVKEAHSKELVIEFKSWRPTQYIIEARDDFIASMADVMESLRLLNFSIHLEDFLLHMFPEKSHNLYQVVMNEVGLATGRCVCKYSYVNCFWL